MPEDEALPMARATLLADLRRRDMVMQTVTAADLTPYRPCAGEAPAYGFVCRTGRIFDQWTHLAPCDAALYDTSEAPLAQAALGRFQRTFDDLHPEFRRDVEETEARTEVKHERMVRRVDRIYRKWVERLYALHLSGPVDVLDAAGKLRHAIAESRRSSVPGARGR